MFTVLFLYYYLIFPQLHSLLLNSLEKSPVTTSNLLDSIQLRYTCCGIDSKDDYKNLSLDSYPSSCCRIPNCWKDTNLNKNSNDTISSIHPYGCYSVIDKYISIELWTLVSITGICALLQILAITLMCILTQRYKKFDDHPKLTINQLVTGVPLNTNTIHNHNEEPVEITQI